MRGVPGSKFQVPWYSNSPSPNLSFGVAQDLEPAACPEPAEGKGPQGRGVDTSNLSHHQASLKLCPVSPLFPLSSSLFPISTSTINLCILNHRHHHRAASSFSFSSFCICRHRLCHAGPSSPSNRRGPGRTLCISSCNPWVFF